MLRQSTSVLVRRTQDSSLLQWQCVQTAWSCIQCWLSKVNKMVGFLQKSFQFSNWLWVLLSGEYMDGWGCNAWVDWKNIKPFVATAPGNIIPLIQLDSYQCQLMPLVAGSIQQLSMEVEHIPGGCTSLCQPVDVKAIICTRFGNEHFCNKTSHKNKIFEWVMKAYNNLSVNYFNCIIISNHIHSMNYLCLLILK